MATAARELATARMRSLINHLGNLEGQKYGWKTKVARRLGVHPSYVYRMLSEGDDLQAGDEVIERVCSALGIDRSYFTDPGLKSPPVLGERPDRGPVYWGGRPEREAARRLIALKDRAEEVMLEARRRKESPGAPEELVEIAREYLETLREWPLVEAAINLASQLEQIEISGGSTPTTRALLLVELWHLHAAVPLDNALDRTDR